MLPRRHPNDWPRSRIGNAVLQRLDRDSRARRLALARLLVLHAAWKIDREGSHAARVEVSTSIKFFVANVLQQVLDRAIQTHGAPGHSMMTHRWRGGFGTSGVRGFMTAG
ncbi:MAG: acyl-CoA dehydrogenase family protein [bacterium]